MDNPCLKNWLLEQIQSVLSKPTAPAPIILWCDPTREWKELLQKTCGDAIELWADEGHELLLRHRFAREERRSRVIWLPRRRAELTYFRVFEGEATFREVSLLEALREYGVEITRTQEDEVKDDLLAYALAKLDEPLTKWKKITPDELISAGTILTVLADMGKPIEDRISAERRHLFKRRVTADFGFPEPDPAEPDKWRIRAVARLLATDAALKIGEYDFPTSDWIIAPGNSRKRAMELLDQWQRDLQLLPKLETLAEKADALLNLQPTIAESSCTLCDPLASYKGEKTLFQNEMEQINKFENFLELATYLARKEESYLRHAQGFWGQRTKKRVAWDVLAGFGRAAQVLRENEDVQKSWHTLKDSVAWYVEQGWRVDAEGECLMQEWPIEEADLFAVQKTLRKAFLQILDRTNTVFSEFAAQDTTWPGQASLPYAGEALKARLDEKKDPAAVIVVDAFRFELGKRLTEMINEGQASPVASVEPCMAPVPTTTELGMAYVLPGLTRSLRVSVDPEKGWSVYAEGFDQNLAIAESRRNWLTTVHGVKPSHIVAVTEAIKAGFKLPEGKLIYLFGDEFDTQGHEGELALSGAEVYLERYAQVIRKLRDSGYGRIFLTTDHGYFHYIPGDHEVIEKPEGDICWKTRRAIVGKNLKHKTAVLTKIAGSDLDCLLPRSVTAFKTYGGIGFFHRGATLQEWLIPLVCIQWMKKSQKTRIVLKPIAEITTLEPIVEVEPETRGKKDLFGRIDGSYLGRQIAIKVRDAASGKTLFKSADVSVSPKDDVRQVKLEKVPGAEGRYGQKLNLVVIDADNEEILATADVTLKIDMDEWL
ncbi:MAG: PglZ domain-containing protein [Pseudomonadota bacterium]